MTFFPTFAVRAGSSDKEKSEASFRTVPARGQGRPATGDQEGEGREICEGAASVLFSGTVRDWFLGAKAAGSRLGALGLQGR